MASYKYLSSRKSHVTYNSVNVVDLVNRAKLEKNKEKKKTIMIAAAAISALAISGIVISL